LASTISNQRSPFVASSDGSSSGVQTLPMLAWKILVPSLEKLLSCGESPESMRATISPLAVSMTSTTRAVDADTSSRLPSAEIAMWSDRWPSTRTRQTIFLVARSNATTSARLGRETYAKRPSGEVKMSSTNWSWPSPISWRIAKK
jgi:hypothetical protein